MRGFYERMGQMVRTGFDPEQNCFVDMVVQDVCPAEASPDQQAKTMATIRQFNLAAKPSPRPLPKQRQMRVAGE